MFLKVVKREDGSKWLSSLVVNLCTSFSMSSAKKKLKGNTWSVACDGRNQKELKVLRLLRKENKGLVYSSLWSEKMMVPGVRACFREFALFIRTG